MCVCVCVCDSNKALDFWLSHLQSHKSVLARHYLSPAFLLATSTDVSVHRLYLDLITAVQPLAQLPFHIDYDFELDRIDRAERSRAAADRDPAAGVRRSLARQSSVPSGGGEAGADVGRRLRTVLGRLGSSATQSLVLARTALQASSSQTSISPPATTRPPRYTDECRVLFISVTGRHGPSGRPFSVADVSKAYWLQTKPPRACHYCNHSLYNAKLTLYYFCSSRSIVHRRSDHQCLFDCQSTNCLLIFCPWTPLATFWCTSFSKSWSTAICFFLEQDNSSSYR